MDKYTLIESYLMNTLSAEEKADFELRLTQDPSLKKDLDAHAKMKVSMNLLLEEDIIKLIQDEGKESSEDFTDNNSSHSLSQHFNYKIFIVAACILILSIIGWWLLNNSQASRQEDSIEDKLYVDLFKPVKSFDLRSDNEILDTNSDKYLEGIRLAEESKYLLAKRALYPLINTPNDDIRFNAQWNYALVLIKLKDNDYQNILNSICDNELSPYQNLACKVKTQLNSSH